MVAKIWRWLMRPRKRRMRPEDVLTDDPHKAKIVAECWNTGQVLTGHVDENGDVIVDTRDGKPVNERL